MGITRTQSGLIGDVDFDAVKEMASYITPVPGGRARGDGVKTLGG
ncbi:hypothetical protein [Acetomicrobium sp. S15 = DSM 107314]